jgi:hypothetical protein
LPDDPEAGAQMRAWLGKAKWGCPPGADRQQVRETMQRDHLVA